MLLGAIGCASGADPQREADVLSAGTRARFERVQPAAADSVRWFRGNTHTHTQNSDGDSPPEVVVRWYRAHGYDFLVLSDHNVFTNPATLAGLVDSSFLLIPGEELTSTFGDLPVHVNGLDIPHVLEPAAASTLLGTIQGNVDAVRAVDGVPHINHPNFRWAIGPEILARVRDNRLLEIFNGHPLVHNEGGGGAPGLEEVWDMLLTGGMRIFGIAVDDAHHFTGEFAPDRANPGRGWISVRSTSLDAQSIMTSLEAGRFYASTGVELEDVVISPRSIEVRIRERGDYRYTTRFIGSGGRVLSESTDNPATHALGGGEEYVRAKVIDSAGAVAWVQPVFVTDGPTGDRAP